MTLTRLLKLISVISLAGGLAPAAFSQAQFNACDLRGTFAFYFEGTLIRTATRVPNPVVVVGTITLDGDSKAKGMRYLNVAGKLVRENATGTYTMDSDGFRSVTFTATPIAHPRAAVYRCQAR